MPRRAARRFFRGLPWRLVGLSFKATGPASEDEPPTKNSEEMFSPPPGAAELRAPGARQRPGEIRRFFVLALFCRALPEAILRNLVFDQTWSEHDVVKKVCK